MQNDKKLHVVICHDSRLSIVSNQIKSNHIKSNHILLYGTGLDCDEVPPTDPLVTVTADELLPIILRALASLLRRRSTERKMKENRIE